MAQIQHAELTSVVGQGIHTIDAAQVATSASFSSFTTFPNKSAFDANDVGRIVLQQDTNDRYVMISHSPVRFKRIADGNDIVRLNNLTSSFEYNVVAFTSSLVYPNRAYDIAISPYASWIPNDFAAVTTDGTGAVIVISASNGDIIRGDSISSGGENHLAITPDGQYYIAPNYTTNSYAKVDMATGVGSIIHVSGTNSLDIIKIKSDGSEYWFSNQTKLTVYNNLDVLVSNINCSYTVYDFDFTSDYSQVVVLTAQNVKFINTSTYTVTSTNVLSSATPLSCVCDTNYNITYVLYRTTINTLKLFLLNTSDHSIKQIITLKKYVYDLNTQRMFISSDSKNIYIPTGRNKILHLRLGINFDQEILDNISESLFNVGDSAYFPRGFAFLPSQNKAITTNYVDKTLSHITLQNENYAGLLKAKYASIDTASVATITNTTLDTTTANITTGNITEINSQIIKSSVQTFPSTLSSSIPSSGSGIPGLVVMSLYANTDIVDNATTPIWVDYRGRTVVGCNFPQGKKFGNIPGTNTLTGCARFTFQEYGFYNCHLTIYANDVTSSNNPYALQESHVCIVNHNTSGSLLVSTPTSSIVFKTPEFNSSPPFVITSSLAKNALEISGTYTNTNKGCTVITELRYEHVPFTYPGLY